MILASSLDHNTFKAVAENEDTTNELAEGNPKKKSKRDKISSKLDSEAIEK